MSKTIHNGSRGIAAVNLLHLLSSSGSCSEEPLVDVIVDQLSVLEIRGRADVTDVRGEALGAVKSGLAEHLVEEEAGGATERAARLDFALAWRLANEPDGRGGVAVFDPAGHARGGVQPGGGRPGNGGW
jgi:hypothetical protein